MLACAEMSEWAAESACEVLAGACAAAARAEARRDRGDPRRAIAARASLALVAEARTRGASRSSGTTSVVSLGAGRRSVSFPRHELPEASSVDWERARHHPDRARHGHERQDDVVAPARARRRRRRASASASRRRAASRSAPTVARGRRLDGPGRGAHRAPRTRTSSSRCSRRRAAASCAAGSPSTRCDAALITNVSDDHIGLYGIDDVSAMAEVKGVVAKAVRPGGTPALNARDPRLVALASRAHVRRDVLRRSRARACDLCSSGRRRRAPQARRSRGLHARRCDRRGRGRGLGWRAHDLARRRRPGHVRRRSSLQRRERPRRRRRRRGARPLRRGHRPRPRRVSRCTTTPAAGRWSSATG